MPNTGTLSTFPARTSATLTGNETVWVPEDGRDYRTTINDIIGFLEASVGGPLVFYVDGNLVDRDGNVITAVGGDDGAGALGDAFAELLGFSAGTEADPADQADAVDAIVQAMSADDDYNKLPLSALQMPADDTVFLLLDGPGSLTVDQTLTLRVAAIDEITGNVTVEVVNDQLGQLEDGQEVGFGAVLAGPPVQADLLTQRDARRYLTIDQELLSQDGDIELDADDGNNIAIGTSGNITITDILNASRDWGYLDIWNQSGTANTVTFAGDKFAALNDLTASEGANALTSYMYRSRPALGGGTLTARIQVFKLAATASIDTSLPIIADPGTVTGAGVLGATMSVTGLSATGADSFTYQWEYDADGDGSGVDIGGATGETFDITASEQGGNIRRETTATNTNGDAIGYTPWVPVSALRKAPVIRHQAVNRSFNY